MKLKDRLILEDLQRNQFRKFGIEGVEDYFLANTRVLLSALNLGNAIVEYREERKKNLTEIKKMIEDLEKKLNEINQQKRAYNKYIIRSNK